MTNKKSNNTHSNNPQSNNQNLHQIQSKTHSPNQLHTIDTRRQLINPGDKATTIQYAVDHFVQLANEAINDHGYFAVALSGGSTPKNIFEQLSNPVNHHRIDWSRVKLFWSDERSVPPTDTSSNYRMAMDAGLADLPIPTDQIYRMKGEGDIEANAREYEASLLQTLPNGILDLVMLGLGQDGHTASLFPETHGLHSGNRHVVANFIPQLNTWRMTLTFLSINQAKHITFYVIGQEKNEIIKTVLFSKYNPDLIPAQRVGTESNPSLLITDCAII